MKQKEGGNGSEVKGLRFEACSLKFNVIGRIIVVMLMVGLMVGVV